jgi:hypothetical protein
MPQIQGSKGEAVVVYRESLLTKDVSWAFPKGKQNGILSRVYISLTEALSKRAQHHEMRNKLNT